MASDRWARAAPRRRAGAQHRPHVAAGPAARPLPDHLAGARPGHPAPLGRGVPDGHRSRRSTASLPRWRRSSTPASTPTSATRCGECRSSRAASPTGSAGSTAGWPWSRARAAASAAPSRSSSSAAGAHVLATSRSEASAAETAALAARGEDDACDAVGMDVTSRGGAPATGRPAAAGAMAASTCWSRTPALTSSHEPGGGRTSATTSGTRVLETNLSSRVPAGPGDLLPIDGAGSVDRDDRLGHLADRAGLRRRLRRLEGRPAAADPGAGGRACPARGTRQLRLPGQHRHAAHRSLRGGGGRPGGGCSPPTPPRRRWAGWGRPRRSPAACASWPRTRRRS